MQVPTKSVARTFITHQTGLKISSPWLYWGWAFELLGSGFVSLSNEGLLDMTSPVHKNVVVVFVLFTLTVIKELTCSLDELRCGGWGALGGDGLGGVARECLSDLGHDGTKRMTKKGIKEEEVQGRPGTWVIPTGYARACDELHWNQQEWLVWYCSMRLKGKDQNVRQDKKQTAVYQDFPFL